jgi:N-acetylmuramoyl-L-alanine amidase
MTGRPAGLVLAAALALCSLIWPGAAAARQSDAASLLTAAMAQAADVSRALDDSTTPTSAKRRALLQSIDRVIVRLEGIPRRYPRSRQANLALHEAASLADAAFQRFARESDRTTALRLYRWLIKEYPGSTHVRHATRRTTALTDSARVAQTVGSGTPTASPAARQSTAPATSSAAPAASTPAMSAALPPRVTPTLASATRARLTSLTHQATADGLRVVLTLDREVAFTEQRVTDPDRMYLDLRTVRLDESPTMAPLSPDAPVSEIRTGSPSPDMTRVVFTTRGEVQTSLYTLYTPFRIVVEFSGRSALRGPAGERRTTQDSERPAPSSSSSGQTSAALPVTAVQVPVAPAMPAPPPVAPASVTSTATASPTGSTAPPTTPAALPRPGPAPGAPPATTAITAPPVEPLPGAQGYSLSRQLGLGISHIVIDPGHGGKDPGASGHGVQESLLTLDVALRLERLLKKTPGIDVTLTRRTDEFVALEERTAIANRVQADLFLSIHANASRNPAANGVETYYLSFAANPEAEAVAARENAASGGAMRQLPDIIRAIALNDKLDESRELAAVVQESMVTRLRRQNKAVRNLGVKKAPFVVLIGARMPSVLAEISFVTNRAEAQRLKTETYKQRLAEALFDAVMRYRRALKQTGTPTDTRNDPARD